jgi:hypothetical protein
MEAADPDYPELVRCYDTILSWGIDNPDCIYQVAAVRDDATYCLSGQRGTARHVDIQLNDGHFALGTSRGVGYRTLWSTAIEDADVSLTLDPPPGTRWVFLRQYFSDWEHERPADLVIERLDASWPPPTPLVSAAAVAERIDRFVGWLGGAADGWDALARGSRGMGDNRIVFVPAEASATAGLHGLAYGMGNFVCEADEAVVLEVTPPQARYWSFALGNVYWESLDWHRRQTSLNDTQAVLDPDGVFRAVIAHRDPGVANWLDPGGHTVGSLTGRYLLSEGAPQPRMERMPLTAVDGYLHPAAIRVDPEERQARLRRRYVAAKRRNRH